MADAAVNPDDLTPTLEDYLEAIYRSMKGRAFTRVRDIAKARGVRTASVVPALRRLRDLGLIDYQRREYVALTAEGERLARRVFARHEVLRRFFQDVLNMPAEAAEADACAMEHGLSDLGMDRLVRFVEFLGTCPHSPPRLLESFHACSVDQVAAPGDRGCTRSCSRREGNGPNELEEKSLAELSAGNSGVVTCVLAPPDDRRILLDLGLLPDARVDVLRVDQSGTPLHLRVAGADLLLSRLKAECVLVAVG